jgi:putative spermidine/putrescine transport system ATP-binding protein
MPSSVALEGVTKRYGATVALDQVSLEVHPGELVALLGGSGCGKTTLLRVVAGLADPDAGRIRIGDTDVTRTPTRHRPIGMVFQHYALFPNMTVAENVAFPLTVRRVARSQISRRVDELLDLVELDGLAGRYPNQLSGGQQQRVALARALAPEPEVLLLDEPLSALDAVIRVSLRDEIRRVQQRVGITTLFVTHDQSEAMALADRVGVMAHGVIEEIAPPAAIWDRPTTRTAALFVGGRNALELAVEGDRRARWGRALEVEAPRWAQDRFLAVFRASDVRLVDGEGQPAAVEMRAFLGHLTRLHVRDADGTAVLVEVPSEQAHHLVEGTKVHLRVETSRVQCFPVDGAVPTEASNG